MADTPDNVYTRYLGFPDGTTAPHFYELLELELFCAQPERIEEAARKQFRRVKPYEDHADRPTREAIQDVMNRIATARVVLTNTAAKQSYDAQLAQRLSLNRDAFLEARAASPRPEYELIVLAGPALVGQRVSLSRDAVLTVGSDPHCVLTLPSSRMAPHHYRLRWEERQWTFERVDRSHVSLVNGSLTKSAPLRTGDYIEAGAYGIGFHQIDRRKTPASMGPPPLTLTIQAGPSVPEAHCSVLPPAAVIIGKDDSVLWKLGHGDVSPRHCLINPRDEHWTIGDLRSASGTWVNDRRIARETLLGHRDHVTVGPFRIQINFRL